MLAHIWKFPLAHSILKGGAAPMTEIKQKGLILNEIQLTSARIFETTLPAFNPLSLRTGNKYLRKIRIGPLLTHYYPKPLEKYKWWGWRYISNEMTTKFERQLRFAERGKKTTRKGQGKSKTKKITNPKPAATTT